MLLCATFSQAALLLCCFLFFFSCKECMKQVVLYSGRQRKIQTRRHNQSSGDKKTNAASSSRIKTETKGHTLAMGCCLSLGQVSATSAVVYTSRCFRIMLIFAGCRWTEIPCMQRVSAGSLIQSYKGRDPAGFLSYTKQATAFVGLN